MRILVALVIAVASVTAQDRFITFTAGGGPSQQAMLVEIDDTATAQRTIATLAGDRVPRAIVMHDDNVRYRVVGNDPFRGLSGFIYDVTPGGVVTTVHGGGVLVNPFAIFRADDGEWIVLDRRSTSTVHVYRLGGTTLRATGTITGLDMRGVALSPESGRLITRAWVAPVPPYVQGGYYEVDLATGRHTTLTPPPLGATSTLETGARRPLYRAGVGEFFDPIYDQNLRGMQVFRIAPGSIKAFTGPYFAQQPTDFVRAGGRAFPAEYHLLTRAISVPVHYTIVQLRGDGNAVSGATQPQSANLDAHAPLLRIGSRHLAWFDGAGPMQRRLEVDFPGEAGRPYYAVLSATGLRPAPTLADGRSVPIALDGLSLASLTGGLPGILAGTVGRLDATGHATATLDWSSFGGALSGTRVWAVAVVIDPAASASVAHISDPIRMVLP